MCRAQGQLEGIRSGNRPGQPEMRSTSASIQRLMRLASAILESLPQASSNTMITGLSAIIACISRHRPASLVYPVLDRPMSQWRVLLTRVVLSLDNRRESTPVTDASFHDTD